MKHYYPVTIQHCELFLDAWEYERVVEPNLYYFSIQPKIPVSTPYDTYSLRKLGSLELMTDKKGNLFQEVRIEFIKGKNEAPQSSEDQYQTIYQVSADFPGCSQGYGYFWNKEDAMSLVESLKQLNVHGSSCQEIDCHMQGGHCMALLPKNISLSDNDRSQLIIEKTGDTKTKSAAESSNSYEADLARAIEKSGRAVRLMTGRHTLFASTSKNEVCSLKASNQEAMIDRLLQLNRVLIEGIEKFKANHSESVESETHSISG